jgi:mercuric ion transport protein
MISTKTDPAMNGQSLRDTGATLLTLGGTAAAFGAASCCGLPFLLAIVGVSSAWLTGIALLAAPHRPLLLWAGALSLAAGAILLWRRQTATACTTDALCSKPAVRGLTVIGLIAGLALLTIGYLYA